jgi:hypothetical protein
VFGLGEMMTKETNVSVGLTSRGGSMSALGSGPRFSPSTRPKRTCRVDRLHWWSGASIKIACMCVVVVLTYGCMVSVRVVVETRPPSTSLHGLGQTSIKHSRTLKGFLGTRRGPSRSRRRRSR